MKIPDWNICYVSSYTHW